MEEILILFGRPGRSLKIANTRGPANSSGARLNVYVSPQESAISRGLVATVGLVGRVEVGLRQYLKGLWVKEFRRPIGIPTTNSHNPSPTDLSSSSSTMMTARPIDVLSPSNSPKLHSKTCHSLMPSSSTPAVLPNARDTTILGPVNVAGGDIVVNGPLSWSPAGMSRFISSILPK